jgi:hypothetical protein
MGSELQLKSMPTAQFFKEFLGREYHPRGRGTSSIEYYQFDYNFGDDIIRENWIHIPSQLKETSAGTDLERYVNQTNFLFIVSKGYVEIYTSLALDEKQRPFLANSYPRLVVGKQDYFGDFELYLDGAHQEDSPPRISYFHNAAAGFRSYCSLFKYDSVPRKTCLAEFFTSVINDKTLDLYRFRPQFSNYVCDIFIPALARDRVNTGDPTPRVQITVLLLPHKSVSELLRDYEFHLAYTGRLARRSRLERSIDVDLQRFQEYTDLTMISPELLRQYVSAIRSGQILPFVPMYRYSEPEFDLASLFGLLNYGILRVFVRKGAKRRTTTIFPSLVWYPASLEFISSRGINYLYLPPPLLVEFLKQGRLGGRVRHTTRVREPRQPASARVGAEESHLTQYMSVYMEELQKKVGFDKLRNIVDRFRGAEVYGLHPELQDLLGVLTQFVDSKFHADFQDRKGSVVESYLKKLDKPSGGGVISLINTSSFRWGSKEWRALDYFQDMLLIDQQAEFETWKTHKG